MNSWEIKTLMCDFGVYLIKKQLNLQTLSKRTAKISLSNRSSLQNFCVDSRRFQVTICHNCYNFGETKQTYYPPIFFVNLVKAVRKLFILYWRLYSSLVVTYWLIKNPIKFNQSCGSVYHILSMIILRFYCII